MIMIPNWMLVLWQGQWSLPGLAMVMLALIRWSDASLPWKGGSSAKDGTGVTEKPMPK
jgi:hypothetical protein